MLKTTAHKHYLFILSLFLFLKTCILFVFILHGEIGLGPDEAQYWTWSRLLDWGYYSKPPGIAWEIWLGTQWFGNTELGVRIIPLLIGMIIPLWVYRGAAKCEVSPLGCLAASLAMACAPIGILASFLAITDGGMVLFWTASIVYLIGCIQKAKQPNYLWLGLLVGGGALFKWPTYSLWLIILMSWRYFPKFTSWRILGGIGISMLALIPSVYWNMTHEWATFKHVFSTVKGGHGTSKPGTFLPGNIGEFIGAQAALVSPILFILLLVAFWALFKKRRPAPPAIVFCGSVSLFFLGIATAMSLFMKMQGNWAIFIYPSAFIVLGWFIAMAEKKTQAWFKAGISFSLLLCGFVFAIPSIQSHRLFANLQIPYRINPFRHNVGWKNLTDVLNEVGYNPHQDFLIGDKYQTASILSFYAPAQKRAYFFNIQGSRKNQFSFWPTAAEEQLGKKGFFIVIENMPQLFRDEKAIIARYANELKNYFAEVRFLGIKPLFNAYGQEVKGAFIFEGLAYNGKAPIDPELY